MLDRRRFMHGRENIYKYENRDITNIQTLSSKI